MHDTRLTWRQTLIAIVIALVCAYIFCDLLAERCRQQSAVRSQPSAISVRRLTASPLINASTHQLVNSPPARPPLGLSLPCEIVEVYDGDTLTARVTLDVRVRLLDCWAAEIRTTDAQEKQRGLAARNALQLYAHGKRGRLCIPIDHADRFDDVITLGRVLGHVWLDAPADGPDLSTWMRAQGHAYARKDDLLKALKR